MKKEEPSRVIPWTYVTLVLLAVAFAGFFGQQTLSGATVYQDYGYGGYGGYGGSYGLGDFLGYGGYSIAALYSQYHVFIDAILFLLIFLGLGKAFLLEHFKKGGTALYIAVGLALTLGLLLWEERTGFSIIYNLGPISIIALLVALYVWIKQATKSHLWATGLTLALLLLLINMFQEFSDFFFFMQPVFETFRQNGALLFWGGIALVIIIFFVRLTRRP